MLADELVYLGPFDNSSAYPMLNSAPSAFVSGVAPSFYITYIASGLEHFKAIKATNGRDTALNTYAPKTDVGLLLLICRSQYLISTKPS